MKCPYCKSELQEGAAFCLYCMKSLNEKEEIAPQSKRLPKAPFIIAAVALVAIITVIIIAVGIGSDRPPMGPTSGTLPSQSHNSTVNSTHEDEPKESKAPISSETEDETTGNSEPEQDLPTDSTFTDALQTEKPDTSGNDPTIQTEREGDVVIPGSEPPVWEYVKIQGGIAVTGVYGESVRNLTVPSQIDGKAVVAIEFDGDYHKDSWEGVWSLTVPDSVKYIGNHVFHNCELKNIILPDGLLYIGEHAFSGAQLESITLPDTVTNIGPSAFYACEKLSDVKLSSALTMIPDSAFFMCYSLENITIPESVTEIGGIAFKYCYTITTVEIMGSEVVVDSSAFDPEFRKSDLTITAPAALANELLQYASEWKAEIISKK